LGKVKKGCGGATVNKKTTSRLQPEILMIDIIKLEWFFV
jgi:hypothetical protein